MKQAAEKKSIFDNEGVVCETVGEMVEALSKLRPDLPISISLSEKVHLVITNVRQGKKQWTALSIRDHYDDE